MQLKELIDKGFVHHSIGQILFRIVLFYRNQFMIYRKLYILFLSFLSHEDAKTSSEDQGLKRSILKPVKASEHKNAGAELRGQVYFLHVPHAHVCDIFAL